MENKDLSAFPFISFDQEGRIAEHEAGLTKREYFAAMFTAAFIQSPQNGNPLMINENAKHGLAQADELLKQLNP